MRLLFVLVMISQGYALSFRDAELGETVGAFAAVGSQPGLHHAFFHYEQAQKPEPTDYPGVMSGDGRVPFEAAVLEEEKEYSYSFSVAPLKDYHVGHVPGDGDCLFWSTGTTRDAFVRFLHKNLQAPLVRQPLIRMVRNDLLGGYDYFEHDAIGKEAVALYRRIARIPRDAPDEFSEGQLRLYIDLVIRENPTLSGPRYSFADTVMANLLSLHLGKNVQVWVEEQLEDDVLQATANSFGVEAYTLEELRCALIEKYGAEKGREKYLETGLDNYPHVTCLRQSHQVFPTTVSVIQRGNHFERLLRSSEEKSLYESERPELVIKYKRHKAIWRALRNVVHAPVVTSGPVPVYLRTVSPLRVWQTILNY